MPSTSTNRRPKLKKTSFGELEPSGLIPGLIQNQSGLIQDRSTMQNLRSDQSGSIQLQSGSIQNVQGTSEGFGSIQKMSGSIHFDLKHHQTILDRSNSNVDRSRGHFEQIFDSKTRGLQWAPNQTQPRQYINIKGYKRALQQLIHIGQLPQTYVYFQSTQYLGKHGFSMGFQENEQD